MLNNQIALLAIDFQVDFLHADGRFPVAQHQVEPMLTAANQLIAAARFRCTHGRPRTTNTGEWWTS